MKGKIDSLEIVIKTFGLPAIGTFSTIQNMEIVFLLILEYLVKRYGYPFGRNIN